ncbi:MFS transporter [Pandoraea bronchicola]|uniref:MFS-type drug efflux transporter P55 n=2 Tax=Pandoraea bronchicola TaxID=2508287 RepID=A0A5E5C0G4_9BURK|nr:MDR family MFS transporter [Pandoraea bronchicola]VVE90100.1 MFS transporter [Pandoraea bronchicola]
MRPFIVASVMAATSMVAIEATIISTAMPQIVAQLGGLNLYSWVFSAFLLAQTAMTVVFGKLADLYGRKPVILVGIVVFLIASLGGGLAWSMPAMIAFRLLQGVGAACIQPVSLTIIADYYPISERGKVQGYLASVWAISAVLGPMLGGIIIRELSWAWIFWINIPIGLLAAVGFIAYLHEDAPRQRPSIDVLGAVFFTIAVAALMIALTDANAFSDTHVWAGVLACAIASLLFVWQERRAKDPMISFALWSRRPIAAANAATLLSGMVLMGLTTFLPMYAQGVLRQTPVVAGMALTMIMVGWPIGATLAAKTFTRFGLRRILVGGSLLMPVGGIVFALLGPNSSPLLAGFGSLLMGFSMGTGSVSALVLIQELVDPSQRGSATASNIFSRNLGSTLGATLFGAVLNFGLTHSSGVGVVTSDQLRHVLEDRGVSTVADQMIRAVLQHSLHLTFLSILAISIGVVLLLLLVPTHAVDRSRDTKREKPEFVPGGH